MVESGHVLVVKVEIYFYNYFTPCLSVCVATHNYHGIQLFPSLHLPTNTSKTCFLGYLQTLNVFTSKIE